MNIKKTLGPAFLVLWISPGTSLAQSPETPPGIDPAAAEKLRSQLPALTTDPPRRVADEQMSCVQIQQELSKIMMGMDAETDALGKAVSQVQTVTEQAQREGGVYTAEQARRRMQKTQPAQTELYSAGADLAVANTASGGMARAGVLMRLFKERNCSHDTGSQPREIADESGDEQEP